MNALSFVDAVHYAPHDVLDVTIIGCDFLACSPYKFYGPHSGVLFGRKDLLGDNAVMRPWKIRTSDDTLAYDETYQMSKWELGTPNFEAMAGVTACVDYIASVGERYGGHLNGTNRSNSCTRRSCSSGGGGGTVSTSRRANIEAGWDLVRAHENTLKRRFLSGAEGVPGLRVYGVSGVDRVAERTSTFAVGYTDGRDPDALTQQLAKEDGIYCTSGNHYCTFWDRDFGPQYGLDDVNGVTRIGFLHYNSVGEVDRVLEALERRK